MTMNNNNTIGGYDKEEKTAAPGYNLTAFMNYKLISKFSFVSFLLPLIFRRIINERRLKLAVIYNKKKACFYQVSIS